VEQPDVHILWRSSSGTKEVRKSWSFPSGAKTLPMNVVLLRVGIDTGCGGIFGPIFDGGSFEFVPIDCDRHVRKHTYGSLPGRYGRNLIDYFPERLQVKMHDCFVHDDPEFKTFTYGDPTRPKQSLRYLQPGDFLAFYAGLCGWKGCTTPAALYVIAYFEVICGGLYPELIEKRGENAVQKMFANNWHVLHGDTDGRKYKRSKSELVLVKGGPGSKLLNKAVRLSAPRKRLDRGGHPIFVLDPSLQQYFGSFTKLNAIQRSIPRWVNDDHVESAARFVRSLE